jgi:non-ribosomal peptide synthetase component F
VTGIDCRQVVRSAVDGNATAVAYPRDKCMHESFEEQAARPPDALAAVYTDWQTALANGPTLACADSERASPERSWVRITRVATDDPT